MPSPSTRFSAARIVTLATLGLLFWFIAALILRQLAPEGALTGWARLITYALVIPATLPLIYLIRQIAQLAAHQVAGGVAIVTAAALLADGLAVAFFPGIYSTDPKTALDCAAAVFWGAGVGLVLGFIVNRPIEATDKALSA